MPWFIFAIPMVLVCLVFCPEVLTDNDLVMIQNRTADYAIFFASSYTLRLLISFIHIVAKSTLFRLVALLPSFSFGVLSSHDF